MVSLRMCPNVQPNYSSNIVAVNMTYSFGRTNRTHAEDHAIGILYNCVCCSFCYVHNMLSVRHGTLSVPCEADKHAVITCLDALVCQYAT